MTENCVEIQREATWVLSNATIHGEEKIVGRLVELGLFRCFTTLLDSSD